MQNLLPLILIGFLMYFIFFRKGGMGCCGSHGVDDPKRQEDEQPRSGDLFRNDQMEEVIDLRQDEYTVLPAKNNQNHPGT